MLPTVSVLVLNHNGRDHLEHCFRSLLALDYPADLLELVLVDSASSDESAAWTRRRFPSVRIIRHTQNWGRCRSYNLAIAQVATDIIVLLNSNTRLVPDTLIELVKPFADGQEIAAVGARMLDWDGKLLHFDPAEMIARRDRMASNSYDADTHSQARHLPFVCSKAMAARRDVFVASGGFDEDFFTHYEDVDLCWRLWVLGHKVWFAPRAIVYYRQNDNWDAVTEAKRQALCERNALLSVIKNCEEQNLWRVLPAALFLLLKQTYLLSGVDPVHYHVEQIIELTSHGHSEKVPQQVASLLLAASDAVTLLPRIMEKRRYIQARRRRPDAEIPSPLRVLLKSSHTTPEYADTRQELEIGRAHV